jgi:hypothetical protein
MGDSVLQKARLLTLRQSINVSHRPYPTCQLFVDEEKGQPARASFK